MVEQGISRTTSLFRYNTSDYCLLLAKCHLRQRFINHTLFLRTALIFR